MANQRTTVQLPDGTSAVGTPVNVDTSTERWSEYELSDGSVLKLKNLVASVMRIDGKWDPEGNPMYVIKGAPIMLVASFPDNLRKRPAS